MEPIGTAPWRDGVPGTPERVRHYAPGIPFLRRDDAELNTTRASLACQELEIF